MSLEELEAVNRRILELTHRRPESDPELDRLEQQAAALIRANCDETLAPLTAALDAAIARAKELLGTSKHRPLTMADFADCMDTAAQTKAELEEVERKLAAKHGVTGDARTGLFELERVGKIDDDDPEVREWQALYHRHLDWLSDVYDGEIMTFERALDRLERIEVELAAQHNITGDVRAGGVRQVLLTRLRNIPETELVADWHDAYASYLNFLRHQDTPGNSPGLYGQCHSCKRHGRLRETEFSREHNRLRGAVCELGCEPLPQS